MLNKVILIGRLANEPEAKYTPSGIPVTTFRLAVDRPLSNEARQAGQDKQADFIDIVAWRQAAEFAANYLNKGRLVAVDGRLQVRQYVAQDGGNRRVVEVVVDQLKSLERPRESGTEREGAARPEGAGGHVPDYGTPPPERRFDSPAHGEPTRRPPAAAPAARPSTKYERPVPSPEIDHAGDAFDPADDLDDPFADD
jgi:single-strand DNA-binding protein